MTAVCAISDGARVWMGADSAGVGGTSLQIRRDEKVFQNGDMLIGCTSSFRMISLLRYTFKQPPKKSPKQTDLEYLHTSYIDAIRRCFKSGGFGVTDGGDKGGTFLIGWKGNLYMVQDDYQIACPVDRFSAVGCGEDLCLGSLYSTTNMTPEDRIRTALEVAERYSSGVRGPFIVKSL
jgi:hypothetical protein